MENITLTDVTSYIGILVFVWSVIKLAVIEPQKAARTILQHDMSRSMQATNLALQQAIKNLDKLTETIQANSEVSMVLKENVIVLDQKYKSLDHRVGNIEVKIEKDKK